MGVPIEIPWGGVRGGLHKLIFLFEAQLWAFYNFTLHVLKISPNLRLDVLINYVLIKESV